MFPMRVVCFTTLCKKYIKITLKKVSYVCSKIFIIFWGNFFQIFKNGQKKCPKLRLCNSVFQIYLFYCIIEIYGLVTLKYFLFCYDKFFYFF